MYKIFKFPQDICWIIIAAASITSIVASSIHFNLIAFLISVASFLGFAGVWVWAVFIPWYRIYKSLRFTHAGIKFCYHRVFDAQEKIQIKSIVGVTEQKLTSSLALSKVCVIEDAFSNLVVFFVDSINVNYYNKLMNTNYKKIAGLAWGRSILVDISGGIISSALGHEMGHVILDHCSSFHDEESQHVILRNASL